MLYWAIENTHDNQVGGGIGFLMLILVVLFFLDRRD